MSQREKLAQVVFRRAAIAGDGSTPLGMLFGVESGYERLSRYMAAAAKSGLRRRTLNQLRRTIAALRPAARFPRMEEYEQGWQERGSGKVLYQTRAWNPAEGSDPSDRERLNESRASLIRLLRRELGGRFVGGFIPDDFSRAHYGDLLSKHGVQRSEYLKLVKGSDVGIASIGLHQSTPFKIPEYLAAGRAIVSEPLIYDPGPSPGDAIMEFRSVGECLQTIDTLLSDKKELSRRQDESVKYWRTHVRPDRIMERVLQSALEVE
ncbi:MAG: hypothetical protein ACOX61_04150 [Brooklawnia sp.]